MSEDLNSIKYEVKFFLQSNQILNEKHELQESVKNELKITKAEQRYIQFIDTVNKEMYQVGWILRNRKVDDGQELTYKKRYPITNDDIEAMLVQAKEDGFDLNSTKFEPEVDWGFTKKTLSLSFDTINTAPDSSNPMSIQELREKLLQNAPEEFRNWKMGGTTQDKINEAIVYGPVFERKYTGEWQGHKVKVEIWSMDSCSEVIVEVSLKKFNEKDVAIQQHQQLKEFLSEKKWLLEKDILKTEWVLNLCK
ncbi:hypothetical protein WB980_006120 [Bacillus cereus]|uniref:hypothetical protein n=1 Tax=Bacillus thuringiensis TaxID=1428 RepID=UPI000BF5FD86|nr:hypothetical protein [Bacillus thuringiensis]MED3057116.1 hypothetical protein [Bacillus thuringiensis]PFB77360.1 hypothetical protein CN273_26940 [Bacillus thuringiensis]PFH67005.1 hypothetical protein COI56_26205 [Bacillus thuringiensis]PGZ66931.1 hypothetical protein COE61_27090 [Bacillus thuringiensis]